MEKQYYSQRINKDNKPVRLHVTQLVGHLEKIYTKYSQKHMFNNLNKELKENDELFFMEKLGKLSLLPFASNRIYSKEDVFDLIELFAEYIETPKKFYGRIPQVIEKRNGKSKIRNMTDEEFNNNQKLKYKEYHESFRNDIKRILALFEGGYELTEEGYIRSLKDEGLYKLVDAVTSEHDSNTNEIIGNAKRKFFHYKSDIHDKKFAILELAGVLENFKKSGLLKLNSKDETELFNLLNNFNLRHNNSKQKNDYDKELFYPWIFHNLLSAINVCIKIIDRNTESNNLMGDKNE